MSYFIVHFKIYIIEIYTRGQFHKALSTTFGAWNSNFGAPNTKNGVSNTKCNFQFHEQILVFLTPKLELKMSILNTKISCQNTECINSENVWVSNTIFKNFYDIVDKVTKKLIAT